MSTTATDGDPYAGLPWDLIDPDDAPLDVPAPVAPAAPHAPVSTPTPTGTGADPGQALDQPVQPVQPPQPVSPDTPPGTGWGTGWGDHEAEYARNEPQGPDSGSALLNDIRAWLARYIITMTPGDLDLLALWAMHTHLAQQCYTSPRLQLDSPMPGSGKTTVLDHLHRLCRAPVQMAAISSSALLARLLESEPRTLLIDEVDRTLDPKREGSQDIIAILNSGYRVGASRPVLEPVRGGGWEAREMPVFAPVAMAGNNPNLPDDTRSRVVRVLLLPDLEGNAEESDWELIEPAAHALRARMAAWALHVAEDVRVARPGLPAGVIGRNREKWGPLARIAHVAGGTWPATVDELATLHLKEQQEDREDGLVRESPGVLLLKHIHAVWPDGASFVSTQELTQSLAANYPEQWGVSCPFGKAITAQRLGRMLSQSFKVHSARPEYGGARGYTLAALNPAMRRMGVTPQPVPQPVHAGGAP